MRMRYSNSWGNARLPVGRKFVLIETRPRGDMSGLLRWAASTRSPLLMRPQTIFVRSLAKRGGGKKGGGKGGGQGGAKSGSKRSSGSGGDSEACSLVNVQKILGSRTILDGVNMRLLQGAKVGVLGANGAGKSTLLKLIGGMDADYEGTITYRAGLRVGMLEQEPKVDDSRDVMSNVTDGVMEQRNALERFDEVNERLASADGAESEALLAEQSELSERLEVLDCWNLATEVETAMRALNCPAGDAMPGQLSGGQRRRVALCRLLLSKPDVLLLDVSRRDVEPAEESSWCEACRDRLLMLNFLRVRDAPAQEPTNHLDAASVAWVESYLASYRGSVVAVTHDRYFLDNVAGWILEIDRGALHPFEGNYSQWLAHKAGRLRQEERDERALSKRLRDELEWIRTNPRGGRTKSKARVRSYEQLAASQDANRDAERVNTGAIAIAPGPRLGGTVLVAENLAMRYGERELFRGLSFTLPPAAILGIVGANGTGKTSLLRLIAGELDPHEGEMRLGPSVRLGYASQTRDGLAAHKSVYEEISQGLDTIMLGTREVNVRAYVAAFNLKGAMQEKLVGSLSGGERGRVHLAKTLREGCNLLLLDEPSNDLDVDTLRSLEEALSDFAGSAVVVSHDRWFLDRVCSHTLAFEPDGSVEFFEGSVSEYAAWRERHRG